MAQTGTGRLPGETATRKAQALPVAPAPAAKELSRGTRDTNFGRAQLRAVGQRLRQLREARNWSLKELALNSGVSVAAIHKIELGAANTGLSTVLALSEALGEPVDGVVSASMMQARVVRVVHVPLPERPVTDLTLSRDLEDALLRGTLVVLRRHDERSFPPGEVADPMFIFVLSGRLVVRFGDGDIETLAAGDAMHLRLDPTEGMVWCNRAARLAQLLFIADPRKLPSGA